MWHEMRRQTRDPKKHRNHSLIPLFFARVINVIVRQTRRGNSFFCLSEIRDNLRSDDSLAMKRENINGHWRNAGDHIFFSVLCKKGIILNYEKSHLNGVQNDKCLLYYVQHNSTENSTKDFLKGKYVILTQRKRHNSSERERESEVENCPRFRSPSAQRCHAFFWISLQRKRKLVCETNCAWIEEYFFSIEGAILRDIVKKKTHKPLELIKFCQQKFIQICTQWLG